MRNINHLLFSSVVALAVFCQPETSTASSTVYEWRFGSSGSPALPELTVDSAGLAQATIAPGTFSDGWISTNAILGTAQGVWDLGVSGLITLSNPAGLAGASDQDRLLTVSVTQYQDGGIYSQLAGVSAQGAAFVASSDFVAASARIGQWITRQTQLRAASGVPLTSIVIAGVSGGTLVDTVRVESATTANQPVEISIRQSGPAQIEISWPANFTNAVLESTTGLDNELGWVAVSAQVQTGSGKRFVTLEASARAQLYRLKP